MTSARDGCMLASPAPRRGGSQCGSEGLLKKEYSFERGDESGLESVRHNRLYGAIVNGAIVNGAIVYEAIVYARI